MKTIGKAISRAQAHAESAPDPPTPEAMQAMYTRICDVSGWQCVDTQTENMGKHYAAFAAEIVTHPDHRQRWLTVSGSCGCGKTMLARTVYDIVRKDCDCFINNLGITECRSIYFVTADKFAEYVRSYESERLRDLEQAFFLCIDDVGVSQGNTNWIADALRKLLDRRLNKWTLLTTNLSSQEIGEMMDARIFSRLRRDGNKFINPKLPDWAER